MAATPILKDKRFILTTLSIAAVVALAARGVHLNEQELTFLGLTLTAFIAQSQAGQRYGEKLVHAATPVTEKLDAPNGP